MLPVRFITPTELQSTATYLPNYQPAYHQVRIEYIDLGLADYANKNVTLREQIIIWTEHPIQPRT